MDDYQEYDKRWKKKRSADREICAGCMHVVFDADKERYFCTVFKSAARPTLPSGHCQHWDTLASEDDSSLGGMG